MIGAVLTVAGFVCVVASFVLLTRAVVLAHRAGWVPNDMAHRMARRADLREQSIRLSLTAAAVAVMGVLLAGAGAGLR